MAAISLTYNTYLHILCNNYFLLVFLFSSGRPGTHYEEQVDISPEDPPDSSSRVL